MRGTFVIVTIGERQRFQVENLDLGPAVVVLDADDPATLDRLQGRAVIDYSLTRLAQAGISEENRRLFGDSLRAVRG